MSGSCESSELQEDEERSVEGYRKSNEKKKKEKKQEKELISILQSKEIGL